LGRIVRVWREQQSFDPDKYNNYRGDTHEMMLKGIRQLQVQGIVYRMSQPATWAMSNTQQRGKAKGSFLFTCAHKKKQD
jgi:hypothetical protein